MKVKLKDLAQMCGVDASTVSRAIKNDPRISKETTERVQEVARKMGYQPNLAARLLKQGHSHIFWFVVPALGTSIDWKIAERASIAAAQKGYDTAIAVHHGRQQDFDRLIDNMGSGLAAGAVINRRDIKDVSSVRRLLEMNFPVVFIDVPVTSVDVTVISSDNMAAASGLVERCLKEGVEEFIVLFARDKNPVELQRYNGVVQAATAAGIPVVDASPGGEGWKKLMDGQTRIGVLASSQDVVQDFLAENLQLFNDKQLVSGCFDDWQGEPSPSEKVIVAVQDYDGMADAALDHLFAALDGSASRPEPILPIAEYQVLNGRF
ncbi:LacI family DNA-binding transcriptional regulator [Tichowtungia aerotolerans]|uniref:LacI family DNA-binding transcriptional regulator n=1 Tax=Tichowtungia aerotolerans TaxID=2697043 RepID=A0A6P1M6W7_9BACT|nr:LacI family DNA-binding transcriptional regulator [Tichowtungia aerotolerans]QHI68753.1 LacI family DNA-binding transcriptional regulator [Tichowtungia aerotolerans]